MITRYSDDLSRPTPGSATRDLALRVVLPGALLWSVVIALGGLLGGPLSGLATSEESVNRSLAAGRTASWNAITAAWSQVGNTPSVVGVCLVAALLLWWRTRQWWVAVIPLIAVALQSTVFLFAALVVGRDRPDVERLDDAPPTSSFPSGHTGASSALYFSLALMATRIQNAALRSLAIAICLAVPVLVAFARLYRGMHHVTDVVVGMANGAVCALLAWLWLRRSRAADQTRA